MNTIDSSSSSSIYDLLSNYSTAASYSTETLTTSTFTDLMEAEVETEAEAEAVDESTELDGSEGADTENETDDATDEDDDSSSGSTSSDVDDALSSLSGSYYRPAGLDPLDPNDMPSDELSFTDMLQLMILQFQNQTIDDTASTTDMMNQLTQMTTMQAMTSMESSILEMTATNAMMYNSALVGQEVTVGYYDENGLFQEKIGTVGAAGYYDGVPVFFFEGETTFHYTSEIMAIGRLPSVDDDSDTDVDTDVDVDTDTNVDTDTTVDTDSDTTTDTSASDYDGSEGSDTAAEASYVNYSGMTTEELLAAAQTALG